MQLYFKQTPNGIGRLFGKALANGKEYVITNEDGQTLYTLTLSQRKLFVLDANKNQLACVQQNGISCSTCVLNGINGLHGIFDQVSAGRYQWVNAGYIMNGYGNGTYDIFHNGNFVMRITKKHRFRFIKDNHDYLLDISDPHYTLDGLVITTAFAFLNYHRAVFFPIFTLLMKN